MAKTDESTPEIDELWPSDMEEISPPGPGHLEPFSPQVKQEDEDKAALAPKKKKKTEEYQVLDWPYGRNPSSNDVPHEKWIRNRFLPPGAIAYPPIQTYRNYDKIYHHRDSRAVSEEEQVVIEENRKVREGARASYSTRLALKSNYLPNDPDWWFLSSDVCVKDDESRRRTAAQFVADAVEYEDEPFCWDLVVDELKLRIEDHLGAARCIKNKYHFTPEDDPFRSPNLDARAKAIAAYTQILDLLTQGLPSLLAAHEDEALILQGKQVDMKAFKEEFGWDADSFAPGRA